jgi:cytochrome c oxidase assembly protein subunit 15
MSPNVHRFAVLTAVVTAVLLTAGALVTSKDAGDSVPDWPLSYGRLIPQLDGNIKFEWGHRVVAGVVLILTLALAAWIWRTDSRGWMRSLGWLAFGAVLAQALLGGLRVLNPGWAKPIAVVHAALAQTFFGLLVSLCVFTSRWWSSAQQEHSDNEALRIRGLAQWAVLAVFLQMVLGAVSRHFKFVVNPHLIVAPHVLNAFVVLTLTILLGVAIRQRFADEPAVRKPAKILSALVGTQILLGLVTYWTVLVNRNELAPWPPMVWATVAHLVVGALTLACAVTLAICLHRLVPRAQRAAAVSAEQATT